MKYRLKIIPKGQKDMDDLEGKDFNVIKAKLMSLSDNPRPIGCKKLTNEEGHRIRVGDFRILYRIDDKAKEVIIYRVKHRKDVYR